MFGLAHAADTILAPDVAPFTRPHALFESAPDRALDQAGQTAHRHLLDYVPATFSQLPHLLQDYLSVDVFVVTVSPLDKAGYFSLGTSDDYASTAARCCRRLIVEVNEQMPRVVGDGALLHVSEVDAIVEHHAPLIELPSRPPRPEDEAIGRAIAELVPDGATLQLGVGGIPDAVARYLGTHKDLGIHSELFGNGMVDLIERGVVTGREKALHRWKHVFANAMGDRRLYDFIDDNPSMESHPISHTNDHAVIAQHDNFVSINSILEVDLSGQCNAEFLSGHQYSGTGGQLDFVRGAFASRGGKSFLAFYSTAGDGRVSRVVPRLESGAVVTTPRTETEYLVTEQGLVNVKGKSARERALGIVGIAHPAFRDELLRGAQRMDLV
jgi:itaconate CoA-transferase